MYGNEWATRMSRDGREVRVALFATLSIRCLPSNLLCNSVPTIEKHFSHFSANFSTKSRVTNQLLGRKFADFLDGVFDKQQPKAHYFFQSNRVGFLLLGVGRTVLHALRKMSVCNSYTLDWRILQSKAR